MKILLLTTLAMTAFAGNSLLCRLALDQNQNQDQAGMDPASFTTIRLLSGALILWIIVHFKNSSNKTAGNWLSALALFAYAACFSFAYVNLSTAMGALLLFGAVQATMIGHGIYSGERLRTQQITGLILALAGLTTLLWPGLSAPPLTDSLIMFASGIAWAIYSLRGKGSANPTSTTARNFILSIPFTIILSIITINQASINPLGITTAILSGAITSGLGYVLWYQVLPSLKSTTAATVQLSVPVIAAFAGVIFLQESITPRLTLASATILGGIALVIIQKTTHTKKLSPTPPVNK
ncbi:MAG: DMT family transporter [Akkermansiaceae bacterium]